MVVFMTALSTGAWAQFWEATEGPYGGSITAALVTTDGTYFGGSRIAIEVHRNEFPHSFGLEAASGGPNGLRELIVRYAQFEHLYERDVPAGL